MRIRRLELKAFGPFTDRILAFDSEDPGLHIIFGSNEAGKSSSLRALKALLYGFPQQTPDNFIHSYDQLLVGGLLQLSDGKELYFQRRKKPTAATIIDEHGDPLDPSVIAPFIHSVEPEIFETLYGIDHQTLVQGGKEILARNGELGQALFAAGAGISSLQEVVEELEQEAAGLFKPSGQLPKINKAIRQYKELQKELRAASLSSGEWQDLQNALKDAEDEREILTKEREQKNKECRRLERLEQAIPELAKLQLLQKQLDDLGEVILLPPGFSEQYQQVSQEIRELKLQLEKDNSRFAGLKKKRNAISFNRKLLDHAERVDDFHQRLGEYRKSQQDRPQREGMRISLRTEAASLLKQMRPDLPLEEVETVRPMLNKKRSIHELSRQYEGLSQLQRQAKKQLKTSKEELRAIEEKLAAIPEFKQSDGLRRAVKIALKAGNVDEQLDKISWTVEQGKKEYLKERNRMGLWTGDLPSLMELSMPLAETLQMFGEESATIADEKRGLAKDRKNYEMELKSVRAEMKKLECAGEVPSEEHLSAIRNKRDLGWQLIKRSWLDQEDVTRESRSYDPETSLSEAFEGHMGNADQIADRLRREADRVASSAALRAKAENLQAALSALDKETEKLERREQEFTKQWEKLWQPAKIIPLTPREMEGWVVKLEQLRYKVGEILKKEEDAARLVAQRNDLRQELLKELAVIGEKDVPPGEKLQPVLIVAETILEKLADRKTELDRLKEARKTTGIALDQAERDLADSRQSLAEWQKQWNKILAGFGLKAEPSTLEAIDLIENLQNCFDKLKEADDLKKRIDGIDRDAAGLQEDVTDLLNKVAPEISSLPLDQSILQLRTLLDASRHESTKFTSLTEEIEQLENEIAEQKKARQSAEEQLEELLTIAKCTEPEELAEVINKSAQYRVLREKITETEENIARLGAGSTIEDLSRQAEDVEADELPGQIDTLQREVKERIHPEIIRISQDIGEITTRLAAMDGSSRAAEAAEKMAQELAALQRHAEHYARVKLASRVLQQEIERYRSEHQDPILRIASGYFSAMTLRSFAGLRADVDDKGEPIIVGVRTDDTRLGVEGMSDGTCDQLYLALRLATLEKRLESSEPMPFIVDDILINFDDDRSRATLQVFAELAARNQVILFTHHGQIVDESRKLNDRHPVFIHEL